MAAKKEQGKGVTRRELSWHLLWAGLLYVFKAAPRGRSRAADSAPWPSLSLPLRLGRCRLAGAKGYGFGGR